MAQRADRSRSGTESGDLRSSGTAQSRFSSPSRTSGSWPGPCSSPIIHRSSSEDFSSSWPFLQATAHHQNVINLRGPILVGFFLASLVIHGGLQGWWLGPIAPSLTKWPLFVGSTFLTSFNDNAAITYLASQVEGLDAQLKFAVLAGAVTGGGLNVIANAPNPPAKPS